jgi:O-antigen ligase
MPSPAAASTRRGKVAFFFLLLFTAVLFGRPSDILQMAIPFAEAVAIAAVLAYALARVSGRLPLLWTTELKLIAGLTIWFAIGVPFSFWRSNSLQILTNTWLKSILIFFLLTQTVFTLERLRKLLWVIIGCEFVISAYSLAHGGAAGARNMGAIGGFLSGNYLGIAAAMTLPYIFAFLIRSRAAIRILVLVATFAMLSWMVVLTASRGGFMSVAASLVLSWWFLLGGSFKLRVVGIFGLLVVLLVALAFAPTTFWERMGTMWGAEYAQTSTSASAVESRWHREFLFRRSVNFTYQNPMFGVGLGNFPAVLAAEIGPQGWYGSHNSFTQVSSEAGVPALVMFVALIGVTVRRLWRLSSAKLRGSDSELNLLARATVISILSVVFGGFFAHLAYDYYFYYFVGISVALQAHSKRESAESEPDENLAAEPAMAGSGRLA